ncbi:hypothetical protein B296_00020760 [Ensete ventricosum]|uniref:Uncharacterized protein n=1 Tax=Ensete ventricosum TaxID=4639 RepID=A0A427B0M5_ENSVE|nr:hypothetical protein B296_00020760 [Ensete ventricosum]
MYSGSSDGEGSGGHEAAAAPKKIPSASSMPWVRNLRRYVGSGTGLGSEALMGLFPSLNLVLIPHYHPSFFSFFPLRVSACLAEKEMEAYIRGLIPNLAQLRDMPAAFVQMYCRIAVRKFFFFCDPHRRGKADIKKVLLSNCLQELMELHQVAVLI